MNYIKTDIEGVFIIEPKVFGDHRGYFMESFSLADFQKNVGKIEFVQDNESLSEHRGVIRGMHFQKGDSAQAKLVRVIRGKVLDVAVDLRPGSPSYGKHVSVLLTGENKRMFFIPRGFAHGFAVLEENTLFQYKCDNYYDPSSEGGYRWDSFGIDWGIEPSEAILSEKDKNAPLFGTEL